MAYQSFLFRVAHAARPDDPALIALGGQQTLADLHNAIQTAFHFDFDHLYSFFMSGRAWDRHGEYAAIAEGGGGAKPAHQARIEQLDLKAGSTFLYLFDYGDEHHFFVRVEEITPSDRPLEQAHIERAPADPPPQYEGDEDEDDEEDEDDDYDEDEPISVEESLARIAEMSRMAGSPDAELEYDWGGDGSNPHAPVRVHVETALVPTDAGYPPPLDQLLRLGDPRERPDMPVRIAALRLTQEHVPDLVRMTRDRALNTAMGDTDEVWAPIHALRALEHLDVSAFVSELIPLFDVDTDWFGEHLPDVLRNAGAGALEPLRHYLQDRTRWIYGRSRAANAMTQIAQQQPELREQAVQIISDELERASENNPVLNGFLLSELLNLDAVEALPVIRRAFEQNAIDETIAGDWQEVLKELGQTPDPDDPLIPLSRARWDAARASMWPFARTETSRPQAAPVPGPASPKKSSRSKEKNKRKMAKASRKANRSKKKRK